ncbi:hypothetical protein BH11PSE3_BH11PSE3_44480 [soil metagenome]
MVDLLQELESAMQKVLMARDRLAAAPPDAPSYQASQIDYLEATVHHLAVLAIAQSRQYEDLSDEVAELRSTVKARPRPAEPVKVH